MDTLLRIGLGNALAASALAIVAVLASKIGRKPALSHGLWLLVLLKLVTPPIATFDVDWPTTSAATPSVVVTSPMVSPSSPFDLAEIASEEPVPIVETAASPVLAIEPLEVSPSRARIEPETPPRPGLMSRFRLLPMTAGSTTPARVCATVWLVGSIAWIGLAAFRLARFQRALGDSMAAPIEVQWRSNVLANRIGLRRQPEVSFLPAAISPLVWAFGSRPRLLVPLELWSRLGEDQRDSLLIHELAHLKRGDHWVRLLEIVVCGLFWWLPTAWWARRGLREAEEECCDAWVVWALPESNRSYASALLETVEFLSESQVSSSTPIGASGMGQFRHLSRRIAMIMKGSTPRRLSWVGFLGVIALAALLLPFLPRLSARQEPRPKNSPILGYIETNPVSATIAADDGPTLMTLEESDPSKLDDARDEVELAEATVAVRKAAVESALAGQDNLKRALDRLLWAEDQFKKKQLSQAQLDVDRRELRKLDGGSAAHQAVLALREAEIRLRQAKRRLERLEMPIAHRLIGPDGQPFPGASGGAPMMPGEAQRSRTPPNLSKVVEEDDSIRLRKIGLALHKYIEAKGQFPPASVVNDKGTPLLSWRVLILPYLDDPAAKGLFEQFHLDEPWDSPRNKPLAMKMPRVYGTSADLAEGRGVYYTNFRALVGPGAGFEEANGLDVGSFTDGTSNTLLVVRASTLVPWTMPNELDLKAVLRAFPGTSNLPEIRSLMHEVDLDGNGFLALFADGRVRHLSPLIRDLTLRALLTRNGGEVISSDEILVTTNPSPTLDPFDPIAPVPSVTPARSPDSDRRIAELERKMEGLLREMEAIRKEQTPKPVADPANPEPPEPKSGQKPSLPDPPVLPPPGIPGS